MKISVAEFKVQKITPNSAYNGISSEFLFHSNKLEGSTFSEEELVKLVEHGVVEGSHTLDDVMETKNSVEVFDYTVDTLGEPIDQDMLVAMNKLLFRGTTEEANGFSGHYKQIANRISGSSVQLALPSDIPAAMPELLEAHTPGEMTFQQIVAFHARFEHLHPFQNGNGRIGRFLMLKQCVESGIDLIVVDEEFEKPYKACLEVAHTTGDLTYLEQTLADCQKRFDDKMRERGVARLIDDLHRSNLD